MSTESSAGYLEGLLTELLKLPAETGWLEFKENNASPEEIGEYLSALSNGAALEGKVNAYIVWGVEDQTRTVMGTNFKPNSSKKGNEDLENWLLRLLNPRLHFRFYQFRYHEKPVVLLEIPRATGKPTQFSGMEYIRVGSYRQKLREYPQLERELWRVFDATPFEDLHAMERVDTARVLSLLDYPSYFDLLTRPLPTHRARIMDCLVEDGLIVANDAGSWSITNLGAILFARNLGAFKRLSRKAVRVVVYEGRGRLKTNREQEGQKGYAAGFQGLIDFVDALLPRNEVIKKSLRKDVPMYPELAIRELVANALIHQDFAVTGSGPMVEIFSDRMEITNPGVPLMNAERFLDSPPRSRNEALASFMRRAGICEERGSGIDKVVSESELYQLPAPIFEAVEGSTRAILFAFRPLSELDRSERVRGCYLHACLRYVERDPMTNSSLRDRFGIEAKKSATASRIIRESVEDGMVKPYDPEQGKRNAKYLPFWA
jgi:ATP-dependent DNA helicase RecG